MGTRLHPDCYAMRNTAKITPGVPSTFTHNALLPLLIIRDSYWLDDTSKIRRRIPSTCV